MAYTQVFIIILQTSKTKPITFYLHFYIKYHIPKILNKSWFNHFTMTVIMIEYIKYKQIEYRTYSVQSGYSVVVLDTVLS